MKSCSWADRSRSIASSQALLLCPLRVQEFTVVQKHRSQSHAKHIQQLESTISTSFSGSSYKLSMSSEWVRHSVDKFVDSHLLLLVPLQAYHLIIETRFQRCLQMQSNLDQGKHEALGSCVGSRTWSPHKHANCPCETRLEIILLRAKLLSKIRFYTLSITLMNRYS